MPSRIAPYTLPSENTTEAQLSQNFSHMYTVIGKAIYSRNVCCNNQLKTIFSQTIHFSRFTPIFPGFLIKFQYFSRTGKTVVIFPGFPGAVGTLMKLLCLILWLGEVCTDANTYTDAGRRHISDKARLYKALWLMNLMSQKTYSAVKF